MPEPETTGTQQPAGRPFPWFCPKCRRKEVRPVTIPYHTTGLHEGRLVSAYVPELVVPRCGKCGELVFDYTADEQLSKAVEVQAAAESPNVNGDGASGEAVRPVS